MYGKHWLMVWNVCICCVYYVIYLQILAYFTYFTSYSEIINKTVAIFIQSKLPSTIWRTHLKKTYISILIYFPKSYFCVCACKSGNICQTGIKVFKFSYTMFFLLCTQRNINHTAGLFILRTALICFANELFISSLQSVISAGLLKGALGLWKWLVAILIVFTLVALWRTRLHLIWQMQPFNLSN